MPLADTPLPAIPAKRYFTIGEVSDLCGVKPYVLRYWEQEFAQLRPVKRRGNRRYYQHHEVLLIRRIRELLYDQGFTISGARNRLTEAGATETAGAPRTDPIAADGHDAQRGLLAHEPAPVALSMAALSLSSSAEIRVWPALPANPNPTQVWQELLAIRDLLNP